MKIGICGKIVSGKSTLANYILNIDDNYEIYSFGDKVKSITNDLFNIQSKNRNLLQQVGSKLCEIDNDIWINYLINKISDKDNIIIDDVRYENEILALKRIGFIIIYLEISQEEQIKRLKIKHPEYNYSNFLEHELENADKFKKYADYTISYLNSDIVYNNIVEKILSSKING